MITPNPRPKFANELIPHKLTPNQLAGIQKRQPVRYTPLKPGNAKAGTYTEFEITHDDMEDLSTTSLYIDEVDITGGTSIENGAVEVNSGIDFLQSVDLWFNGQKLESYGNAAKWINASIAHAATRTWATCDGNVMLKYSNSLFSNSPPGSINGRSIAIPMCLIFGLFKIPYLFPVFQNRLRIRLTWAKEEDAFAYVTNTSCKYELKEPHIVSDMIVVDDTFRQKFSELMALEGGIRIPYTTFDVTEFAGNGSNSLVMRLPFAFSNALSLYMLRDVKNDYNASKYRDPNMISPMPNFERLNVKSGSIQFCPDEGFQGHQELYRSTKLSMAHLCELEGTGLINYGEYTSPFSQNSNYQTAELGYCLMGVNLEKSIEPDDSAYSNAGLSAQANGSTNTITIDLRNKSGASDTFANTDRILINIAHQNEIVIKDGGEYLRT
jgi:hypothetical protein